MRAAFSAHAVMISAGATVRKAGGEAGQSVWVVSDPAAAGKASSYTVWEALDILGNPVIKARPSTPALTSSFMDNYEVVLYPQATIGSISTADGTKAWEVDNDSTNPDNLQTG